jgi:cytochrome c peroxidase
MKHKLLVTLPVLLAAAFVVFYLNHGKAQATGRYTVPPCTLPFDMGCYLPGGTHEDPDVVFLLKQIAATENATVYTILRSPPKFLYQQVTLLGKAEIYDMNLSVNKNEACATCHMPYTGFMDPVSLFNKTIVALPGSVPITNVGFDNGRTFGLPHPDERTSQRNPYTYSYAPFMRPLQFDYASKQFIGGNFWDMRATGDRLGNPAAEQALGPPLNPVEMGNPDEGCVVYSLSQSKYAGLFKTIFGSAVFQIHWPSNLHQICSKPAGIPAGNVTSSEVYKPGPNPILLKLSARDRDTVAADFDYFGESVAAYEASTEVSAFSSKFDLVLQGKAQFTPQEAEGFKLFNGKAVCSQCHEDGVQSGSASSTGLQTSAGAMLEGIHVAGPHVEIKLRGQIVAQSDAPLFTNQEAVNLGLPKNFQIPYLYEDIPDQYGYVANSLGPAYLDTGVYDFLTSTSNPNPQWVKYAPLFYGTFLTPTVRNADKRPYPTFVRSYMHNGYLKSLKELVHFYNTRDVLPRCPQGSPGEGVTCWPPPEISKNETHMIGNLHLTPQEEDAVVAFIKTLTDGYFSVPGITGSTIPSGLSIP